MAKTTKDKYTDLAHNIADNCGFHITQSKDDKHGFKIDNTPLMIKIWTQDPAIRFLVHNDLQRSMEKNKVVGPWLRKQLSDQNITWERPKSRKILENDSREGQLVLFPSIGDPDKEAKDSILANAKEQYDELSKFFKGKNFAAYYKENRDDIAKWNAEHSQEVEKYCTQKMTRHWWLNATPGVWTFEKLKTGDEEEWTVPKNAGKVNPGDLMLGYVTASKNGKKHPDEQQIVCICEVTRKDGDKMWITKKLDLETHVPRSQWKDKALLKRFPKRGSLSSLSDEEWNEFMSLIEEKNKGVRKQLEDSLNDAEKSDLLTSDSVSKDAADKDSRQIIFFGAPGTGKSYKVDKIVKNDDTTIRTTFHPDSDYASFVGAYKPTMKDGKIVYEFVPQAFTKAYVRAWKKMALRKEGDELKKQYLVIEEINRGNCAQIFGDLFQLLDRHDNGFSKYPIDPDTDITNYLATKSELCEVKPADKVIDWINKQLAELTPDQTDATARKSKAVWADILSGSKLVLPPNLYIWATMNTSDQSLFPMDSAFKRRWDWRYSKIKDEGENYRILDGGKDGFDWWQFLTKINSIIRDVTSSPDKQLGYFFVKLPEGQTVIDAETFVNKVVFYLWNDVFKDFDLEEDAFKTGNDDKKRQRTFDDFFKDDGNVEPQKVVEFLSTLLKKDEGQSKPVE